MAYRKKMSRKASKKNFTRNAVRTNKKNLSTKGARPMRGGIRL